MKKNLTELVFILDRSGSMAGLEKDTIGGFNSMIDKQKGEAGEAVISTVLFDNYTEVIHDRLALEAVPRMTEKEYYVRGCTALLDAVGGAIHHIGNVHKYAREEDRPEKTLFVITTDGMENASRRYSYEKVKAMIQRQKEKYGWEFLFLGANIDAAREAARFGISADRAADYHADAKGTHVIYESVSEAVCHMRSCDEMLLPHNWKEKIDQDFSISASFHSVNSFQLATKSSGSHRRKTKDFPLFCGESEFTDDTVLTLAVAEALMQVTPDITEDQIRQHITLMLLHYGRRYPHAGYGIRFSRWLRSRDPQPYGSCGNGSAMRVSSAAWLFDDLTTVRRMARLSAEVTHDHPEGIKGAEATACAIFLARTGSSKEDIRDFTETIFDYDLSRSCDQIRPGYHHVETCQETVPEAITAFLEGESFEDVIRTAVSLGGDCDTLTCIAGSIAEGFYGVPEALRQEARSRLTPDLLEILERFDRRLARQS